MIPLSVFSLRHLQLVYCWQFVCLQVKVKWYYIAFGFVGGFLSGTIMTKLIVVPRLPLNA